MRQSVVRELECNVCGQVRWGVEGSVCSITLGCIGKLKREGNVDEKKPLPPKVSGCIGQTVWTQDDLFTAAS